MKIVIIVVVIVIIVLFVLIRMMNGLHRSGSFDSPVSQLFPPAQHLTSKLCKHSALIKLAIIIIMRDDILTMCPLKRF